MKNLEERLDELRSVFFSNLVEIFVQQSVFGNPEISALNDDVKQGNEQLIEILYSKYPDIVDTFESYVSNRLKLESKRIDYIFEKGIETGYNLATNPYEFFIGDKKTHSENK